MPALLIAALIINLAIGVKIKEIEKQLPNQPKISAPAPSLADDCDKLESSCGG